MSHLLRLGFDIVSVVQYLFNSIVIIIIIITTTIIIRRILIIIIVIMIKIQTIPQYMQL